MAKKLHDIAPFRVTYTVKNIYTGEKFEEIDSIPKALHYAKQLVRFAPEKRVRYTVYGASIDYHCSLYGLFADSFHKNAHGWVTHIEHKSRWSKYVWMKPVVRSDVRPIIIYDNLGNIITANELFQHKPEAPSYKPWKNRDQWYHHRELTDRNLCKRKGDGKKIKSDWATVETIDNFGEVDYDCGHAYFRTVNTKNEQTQNTAHVEEYGQEIVRGRRRNLVSSWDDISSGYWGCRRSWKHNSKRRKQWVPKV